MHLKTLTLRPERFPDRTNFPFSLPILQNTSRIDFPATVTFFAGENGSGKSTLLRALSRKCGIHIWAEESWSRAHYNPYEELLHQFMDISWANGPTPGAFFSAEKKAPGFGPSVQDISMN